VKNELSQNIDALTDDGAAEGAATSGDSSIGRLIGNNTSQVVLRHFQQSQNSAYGSFFQRNASNRLGTKTDTRGTQTQNGHLVQEAPSQNGHLIQEAPRSQNGHLIQEAPSLDYRTLASQPKFFSRPPLSLEDELEMLMSRAYYVTPPEPLFERMLQILESKDGLLDGYKSRNFDQRNILEHAIHLNTSGTLDGVIQKLLNKPTLKKEMRSHYKAMLSPKLRALNFSHEAEMALLPTESFQLRGTRP
jgi:hypothetical protein